jgi:hypothetical protein
MSSHTNIPRKAARVLATAALASVAACSGFLEVESPNVIDAGRG